MNWNLDSFGDFMCSLSVMVLVGILCGGIGSLLCLISYEGVFPSLH